MFGQLIYNLTLKTYQTTLWLLSPLHAKAKKMHQSRQGNWQHISQSFTAYHQNKAATLPIAWFHCASLGKFEQARPLIEAFRAKFSNYKLLLTFFSPSGYEIRKNYDQADWVHYLPFDSQANAQQWFDWVQPRLIFFVKYEFWHYYLQEAHKRKITTLSFSAIFRPEQLFFKPYGEFYRAILSNFSHIFVQNQQSLDLLAKFGIEQVSIAGDTRFDRVLQIAKERKKIAYIEQFKQQAPLLVVGSAWADDLAVLLPYLAHANNKLKVIIAPHEISTANLQAINTALQHHQSKKKSMFYSQITPATPIETFDILVIDNVGMLAALYAYADFAFIGGAYKDGLHNILEAAVYGMPIFFGNRQYKKFQEALDLLDLGGAFLVADTADFAKKLAVFQQHPTLHSEVSQICFNYVQKNEGGTQKILDYLGQIEI
jgi:3-deoxy-D-manno-octulosonic-acid transferase